MRLSCILLVAAATLLTTTNALPASINSDQTMVSKVGTDNGKRLLRSVNTADGDDSSKGQGEERGINFAVLFGLQSVDDAVAAAIAAAPAVMSDKQFYNKLLKDTVYRGKRFTEWKKEHLHPKEVVEFIGRYSESDKFTPILQAYTKFFYTGK